MAANQDAQEKKNSAAEDKKADQKSANQATAEADTEFDWNQEIEQLTQALSGDISEFEAEDGIHLIDEWNGILNKTKDESVKELVADLKNLQKMLKGGKASGHEISELLIHIGESTAEFSDQAEKGSKQAVQKLGKQLRKAGTSIAKAEEKEYHEQFDTLVEQVESDELTSMEADQAVGMIDQWMNLLNKTEGEQFHQVANSLKELKQALKRNNAKPEAIAKSLSHVAEQTSALASDAPRGFKGVIQKLGKQLANTAKSMTSGDEQETAGKEE